jgi:hypothetical protein
MKFVKVASSTAAALIGLAITIWFVSRSDVPGASGAFQSATTSKWTTTLLTAAYGFCLTLAGVALGATYRRLIKLRTAGEDKIPVGQLLGAVFSSVDFYIGLVGAPIVYGLLWQSLADISLAGLSVIALQNGFTSHAILDQFVNSKPAQPAAGNDPGVSVNQH